MRISMPSSVRFQSQTNLSAAVSKAHLVQALRTHKIPHVKSVQAFDPYTIVLWTDPAHHDKTVQQMKLTSTVFQPGPTPAIPDEFMFQVNRTPVMVVPAPEGAIYPYMDYGLPQDKTADPYTP
jgi:hypothetical protein